MNIKVKTKLITSNSNDFTKQAMKEIVNEAVKGIKPELEKELKGFECEKHKSSSKGTVTVVAGTDEKIEIKYSNFCCDEFKNSLKITT